MTQEKATASAPGKLMLFGDHAVVYDYPCIVTAIDERIRATVKRNNDKVFSVSAPSVGVENYSQSFEDLRNSTPPKGAAFLQALLLHFLKSFPEIEGIDVQTESAFSSSFGFGSSSAVTVAFARALVELFELPFTNKNLFDLCYQAVLTVQGVGSGFDIASAIWGGTIYYVKPAKTVEYLEAKDMPLVVGYTGVKADTATLVKMVAKQKQENPQKIELIFEKIGSITELARQAIQTNNWQEVGRLMDANQSLLDQLNVSSSELENLVQVARTQRAFGAKLSGAGGGDCMIALVDESQRDNVQHGITAAGGEVMIVQANAPGVRIER